MPIPLLAAALAAAAVPAAPAPQDPFAEVWYDGRAEMCGYRWSGSRYGEAREGEAVAIFVTEPFSESRHVKVERPGDGDDDHDVVTALKLNLVRDFQTGLYDYDTMSSVFVRADDLSPMKASFSSAEWCGHVYEEIDVTDERTRLELDSYFEGESGTRELDSPRGGVIGDQLLVLLRGLRGHPLEPGESVERPFLPGGFERRLRHEPAAWGTIAIARDEDTRTVGVPAGDFEVITYRAEASGGRRLEVDVAVDYPHRLVRWSWTREGTVLDAGELTGCARLAYWRLNAEGDERRRRELGLPVPSAGD